MQYREEFELAPQNQRSLGQDTLMGTFMNRLNEEIKTEMNIADFETLTNIMDKATVIKARNNAWRTTDIIPGGRKGEVENQSNNFGLNRNTGWDQARPMIAETITRPENNRNIGHGSKSKTDNIVPLKASTGTNGNQQSSIVSGPPRLSTEEWADRQRKGLCFKCGERWGQYHVCKLKHYQIYILEDVEATKSEEGLIKQQENQGQNELELKKLELQLSSYSYWGLTTHKTFKVKGKIQHKEDVILIDPGASTNFIATRIVQELQLLTTRIREFQVEVGNGTIKKGNLGCERVKIEVQGIKIIQSFFVMEVRKTEIVLRAGWMTSLGKFMGDYNEIMISWKEKLCSKGRPILKSK